MGHSLSRFHDTKIRFFKALILGKIRNVTLGGTLDPEYKYFFGNFGNLYMSECRYKLINNWRVCVGPQPGRYFNGKHGGSVWPRNVVNIHVFSAFCLTSRNRPPDQLLLFCRVCGSLTGCEAAAELRIAGLVMLAGLAFNSAFWWLDMCVSVRDSRWELSVLLPVR